MNLTTFRSFFSRLAVASIFATASFVFSANAHAASLAIGGFQNPVPGEADLASATLVNSTGVVPFITSLYSGTLTTNVYTNDTSNPYGLSGMTFEYILTNDLTSDDALEQLSVNGFGTFLTDTSYVTPAVGVTAPSYVDRSITGDSIGFSFPPFPVGTSRLEQGSSSARMIVQTNSTTYGASIAAILNGDIAHVQTFSAVPEPGTIGLAVVGLIGLGLVARRRKVN